MIAGNYGGGTVEEPTLTSKVRGRWGSGGGFLGTITVRRPSWQAAEMPSKLAFAGKLNLRMNLPALRSTRTYLISVSDAKSSRFFSPLIFSTLSFSTCTCTFYSQLNTHPPNCQRWYTWSVHIYWIYSMQLMWTTSLSMQQRLRNAACLVSAVTTEEWLKNIRLHQIHLQNLTTKELSLQSWSQRLM